MDRDGRDQEEEAEVLDGQPLFFSATFEKAHPPLELEKFKLDTSALAKWAAVAIAFRKKLVERAGGAQQSETELKQLDGQ